MHKRLFKKTFLLSALLVSILLSACSTTPAKPPFNTHAGPTTTICPAFGTARSAVMPPLQAGSHAQLVYYSGDNQSNSFIKRIDVSTGATRQITGQANANIIEAQISPDGQWILFVIRIDSPHSHLELRLVRIDGQYQQTVYCIPSSTSSYASEAGQFVWSPDLALVALGGFSGPFGLPAIYLLDLVHGNAQLALASSYSQVQQGALGASPRQMEVYTPLKWLDATRLYVGGYTERDNQLAQATTYLLDTTKGANQRNSDLRPILTSAHAISGPSVCDFDSSLDATQLYVAQCTYKNNAVQKQSSITVQPATGGQAKTIYSSHAFAIIGVRVIDPQTLLIITDSSIGNGYSGDTLWKINTDGSGLTRLASANALTWCSYLQNNCSNVSPDGSQYAFIASGGSADLIYAGSFSGGKPRQVLQLASLYEAIVGWTMV